jgi:hypothetical protein
VVKENCGRQKDPINWAVDKNNAHKLPTCPLTNKQIATKIYKKYEAIYQKNRSVLAHALEHLDKAPHLAKLLTTEILMSNGYGDRLPIEIIVRNGFLKFIPKALFTKELVEKSYNAEDFGGYKSNKISANLVYLASIHDDLHNIPKEFITKNALTETTEDGRTALQNIVGLPKAFGSQVSESGEIAGATRSPCDNSHKFPNHLITEKALLLPNFDGKGTLEHLLDIYNKDCLHSKVHDQINKTKEITKKIQRILKKLSFNTLKKINVENKHLSISGIIDHEFNKKQIMDKLKDSESLAI